MKNLLKKLKPQKKVKVKEQPEGTNPEGKYFYVDGPIRSRDAK
jgi:hypothetical protein